MEYFKICFSIHLSKLEFIERKVLEIHVEKLIPLPHAVEHHSTLFKNSYSDFWCINYLVKLFKLLKL